MCLQDVICYCVGKGVLLLELSPLARRLADIVVVGLLRVSGAVFESARSHWHMWTTVCTASRRLDTGVFRRQGTRAKLKMNWLCKRFTIFVGGPVANALATARHSENCLRSGSPGVQDMYTRLLSANLDFDSELQTVFCWAPDECRDSRVFHVDRVFLRLC